MLRRMFVVALLVIVGVFETRQSTALGAEISGPASADGEQSYERHCAACHLPDKTGVAYAFPSLDERLVRWAGLAVGRQYLVSVINSGLSGPIEVDGVEFNGFMVGLGTQISYADQAQLLNWLVGVQDVTVDESGKSDNASVDLESRVSGGVKAFSEDEVRELLELIDGKDSAVLRAELLKIGDS